MAIMQNLSSLLRRLLRSVVWFAAGGAVLLVLLLLGIAAYSRTVHFQQVLREQLLAVLRNSLDAEVSLEEVRGPVWQGVEIRNLSIRKDGLEVISLARGTISIDVAAQLVSALRTASLNVAHVTITDPVVHLVQDPTTGWNVTHLVKPADQQAPLPLSVLLPRVTVENGQVFARLADGKEVRVSGIAVDAALSLLPSGLQAEIKTSDFSVSSHGIPTVKGSSSLSYEEENGVGNASLRTLDLRTALSHVQLTGVIQNLADPIVAVTVAIDKIAADEVAMLVPPRILKQDLSGHLQIAGPLTALQIATFLDVQHGHFASTVTANVAQSPPDIQGTFTLDRFVLNQVLQIPGGEVAGEVTGKGSFHGTTPATLHADVTAYVGGLVVAGKDVGDVNLTTKVEGKQVTFATEVKGRAGYLYSHGKASLGNLLTYDTTVMVRDLNVQSLTGESRVPLTNINVDVWVKGRGVKPEEMESEAKLTIAPSRIGPTSISQGEFAGTMKQGQLTLNKGTLLANDAEVNIQGRLGALQKMASGKLTYHVVVKNLTPWLALAGIEGKGGIDLNGSADGMLTALHADGKLLLDHVSVGANAIQKGELTYQVNDLGSAQPRGQVSAKLNDVQAGKLMQAVSADVTFAGLQPIDVQADVTVQDEEARTHHLKTQARYAPEQLDVLIQDLTLQLPSGTWRSTRQPHLALHGKILTLQDFVLERAGQAIRASGTFDLQGQLQGQLQVEHFSLDELHTFLSDVPELKGQVDVEVKVQGTVMSPDVTAMVSTGPLTIAGQAYAGLNSRSTYQKEQLVLNLLLKQDDTHTLSIDGGLPLALLREGKVSSPVIGEANFRIHSDGLSLAFLELLNRDIKEVQGAVTMDVSLKGRLEALALSGPIRLQNGHVRVKQLGQAFSDITVEVHVEPTMVRLKQLSLLGGDGRFTGRGLVALERYRVKNLDLRFQADHFRIISTKEYRAELSGDVTCSGSLDAPVVSGEMTVQNAVARPNIALLKGGPAAQDATIMVVRSSQELPATKAQGHQEKEEEKNGPGSSASGGGIYDNLKLDVGITIPRNTWVHMTEGSIELVGQLRANKSPHTELALNGTVETVRGWVAVQGRKFTLEKGNVTFSGETPIDPSLDIIARYTLPEYLVDVLIGGTGTKPSISFKSEPDLEQADILSLLVFGKPANALSDKEKVSLQSQALQAVAGSVASDLRQAVAEKLGIENLELDVGENPSQSKVGIGKYIAPGVFVSTSQQLGSSSQGQGRDVTIEYQLNDNWQLKASTTARGNNGVDILWKKKY
jgi:hypothetical protein